MEARRIAFEVLVNIKTEQAYSNNALAEAFKTADLSDKDKALVTEIVYGTLTNYRLLDFYLEPYYVGRVKDWVKTLLAMSLYQLLYLKRIPDYAAINEAVEIAKGRGGDFNAKVVNSILRKVTVAKELRSLDEVEDEIEQLSIKYSHPTWLARLWNAQFGRKRTEAMMLASTKRAQMVLRANESLITRDELLIKLTSEGLTVQPGLLGKAAILVTAGNPLITDSFAQGLFYVQDEASQLPAVALSPELGSAVLDVCAAPGGKTFHLAQMVGGEGVVYAHDIYEHKIARLRENAQRLKVTNTNFSVCSAMDLDSKYAKESFDFILVDAPCSGLGIIRRHPEVKMAKQPADLDEIVQVQADILNSAARFLRPGGRLVYSTCTVNKKENHRQVEEFLKKNDKFEIDADFVGRMPSELESNIESGMLQLFPQDFATDGFFIASLIKK